VETAGAEPAKSAALVQLSVAFAACELLRDGQSAQGDFRARGISRAKPLA